jgi:hypothetical protein
VRRALTAALAIVVSPPLSLAPAPARAHRARYDLIGDSRLPCSGTESRSQSCGRASTSTCRSRSVGALTGELSFEARGRRRSSISWRSRAAARRTVVIVVRHNDFERTFARSVEESVDALLDAGVTRILWATLRAARRP